MGLMLKKIDLNINMVLKLIIMRQTEYLIRFVIIIGFILILLGLFGLETGVSLTMGITCVLVGFAYHFLLGKKIE